MINKNRKIINIKKTKINGRLNKTIVLLPEGAEDAQRSQKTFNKIQQRRKKNVVSKRETREKNSFGAAHHVSNMLARMPPCI